MGGPPDPRSIGDRAKRGPFPLFHAHIMNKCSGFRLFNVGRYVVCLDCRIVVLLFLQHPQYVRATEHIHELPRVCDPHLARRNIPDADGAQATAHLQRMDV